MKLLLFLFATTLAAQTTITGTLTNASGAGANCSLMITPLQVTGASATKIGYVIVAGDTAGVTSFFGTSRGPKSYLQLKLKPGLYSTLQECDGELGRATLRWRVPAGGSIDINLLNDRAGAYGRTISELPGTISSLTGTIAQQ